MPIVTFWSNNKKAIGQTVAASAAATVMAMEHNYKVILISVDFFNDSMEECFGAQQSNAELIKSLIAAPKMNLDTGINGLLKVAQSNRVTPEMIKDYTKIIYKNRLEVLYSSTYKDISIEEQFECFKRIILNASQYYDHVFIDLKKGTDCPQVFDILNMSDAIVLNTEQGIKTFDEFFKMPETQPYIQAHKIMWNLCRYDKKSKYNTKNLVRTVWKRQPIYCVPYNTLLFEAVGEGTIAELLLRIRTIKNEDENSEMFARVKELTEGILMKYQELRMRM